MKMAHELTEAEIDGTTERSRKATAPTTYPPRWIRLPTRGHCPECGLSRAAAYNLIQEGKIKSACIRKPGAVRGQRLVFLPSVLEFLDRCAERETKKLNGVAQ
jgi:hypothetical protein